MVRAYAPEDAKQLPAIAAERLNDLTGLRIGEMDGRGQHAGAVTPSRLQKL